MNIKENATKGKISTILGVVITLGATVSVFIPSLEIDWTNAAIGMTVGLGLIGLLNK